MNGAVLPSPLPRSHSGRRSSRQHLVSSLSTAVEWRRPVWTCLPHPRQTHQWWVGRVPASVQTSILPPLPSPPSLLPFPSSLLSPSSPPFPSALRPLKTPVRRQFSRSWSTASGSADHFYGKNRYASVSLPPITEEEVPLPPITEEEVESAMMY